jgi:hypothetical protein
MQQTRRERRMATSVSFVESRLAADPQCSLDTKMNRRGWPYLLLFAVVLLLVLPVSATAGGEELEPGDDLFSWVDPPEPYKLAVRAALLGKPAYRKCQVVAIPSFEKEWAVYMTREEGSEPLLVSTRMRTHLWTDMMEIISDKGRKSSYSIGSEAQAAALKRLSIEVDTASARLRPATADLLEEVWWRMLSRVRYPAEPRFVIDGVTYHISHWARAKGFRSGQTCSPRDGSPAAALVRLAEEMRALAEAPADAAEEQLESDARALLTRLR